MLQNSILLKDETTRDVWDAFVENRDSVYMA